VNNTYVGDPRKTGSLYEVKDNGGADVAKDNQWFTEDIVAKGDTITIKWMTSWWRSGLSPRTGLARGTSRPAHRARHNRAARA
jgi:hypothetical protein